MATVADKAQQVGGGDCRGRLIMQGMGVNGAEGEQILIENQLDALIGIVDDGKGGNSPGVDAEDLFEQLSAAEARLPRAPSVVRNCLRSTWRSSRMVTNQKVRFLSRRKRFLIWPPGKVPRNCFDSATVCRAGWRCMVYLMPNAARRVTMGCSCCSGVIMMKSIAGVGRWLNARGWGSSILKDSACNRDRVALWCRSVSRAGVAQR